MTNPTATAKNPTEHTSGRRRRPALFKQKGGDRKQGDEQRSDKGRLGEVAEDRRGWVAGQRREKRACLREERHGEQAEQQIGHEDRDDDGGREHAGQGRPGRSASAPVLAGIGVKRAFDFGAAQHVSG